MNKLVTGIIITAVIVGGAGFYGGMKYGQNKAQANIMSAFQSRRQGGAGGQFGGGQRGGANAGMNGASGEILSKDDKSITLKLRDGGSKIVLISDSTAVAKTVSGTAQDLSVGQQVMVFGSTNSDGSITAQVVQLRPPMPSPTPSPSK